MQHFTRALLLAAGLVSAPVMADGYGLPPATPATYAEIQIFFGYRGYNDYDSKLVSSSTRPLTLDYILRGYQTAACYKGDPLAALDLFAQMIRMYNYDSRRAVYFASGNFYYYADGKGALQIDTRDEAGQPFLQFPRMIECDRWSTPAERGEY